ncbi:serine/threonine protein kinase, partial [Streptomyces sp. SID161]|nr:serine/threonine protein kinase [Streptomyces sp. SID161]
PARPRRRLRTLALVVAAAAVLGGGAAAAFQHWGGQEGPSGTGKGAGPAVTAPPASGSPGPDGTVPASWQRYDDEWGFSLYLPKGWSRKVVGVPGEIRQVDYTPDGGKHFVRIAIDSSPDFADAKSHQEDLEQQIQRLVDYRRVTMAENTYRDCKGSLWEYTWTALAKDPPYVAGPRHAVEETYFSRDGAEYAIYVSGPGEDWAQTSKQFKWVLQTWQQPR